MFCKKVFSYRCILDNINMDSGISLMRQTESDLLVACATWCYHAVETFLAHLFRKHCRFRINIWSNKTSLPEGDPDITYAKMYFKPVAICRHKHDMTPHFFFFLTWLKRSKWNQQHLFGAGLGEQSCVSFGMFLQQWSKREQFEIEMAEK